MPKINVEKRATLTGHKDCIYALEKGVENDFFSSGGDGMVVRWFLEKPDTGKLLVKVDHSVYALRFVEKDNSLLIGNNFRGLHKVPLDKSRKMISAAVTSASIFDIRVIRNLVFTATGEGMLAVNALDDLSAVKKIRLCHNNLRQIAVHPDETEIAVGSSDNKIYILSVPDLKIKQVIDAHKNSVFAVSYTSSGEYLVSGSRDAHLKIWNTDNYSPSGSVVAHMFAINDIAFHPGGEYFATCSMDKSIKVWQTSNFKLLKVIDKGRYAGHGTSVNKLFWSDYFDQLVSCSDDRTLSIWNINLPENEDHSN